MSIEVARTDPAAFVEDQRRFGVSNVDAVRTAVSQRLLSRDQNVDLASAYLTGINSRLRACFPRDAMDNLRALTIVAKYTPPRKIELNEERIAIMEGLGFPTQTTHVTTRQAFQHFRPYVPYYRGDPEIDPRVYEEYTARITDYIAESVRRGHTEQNSDLLEQVVPMLRVLAYLHKAAEKVHYTCQSEFDDMTRWAVDRDTLEFVTLTQEQALARGEVTSDEMFKQ